jgi:hypothetical protein
MSAREGGWIVNPTLRPVRLSVMSVLRGRGPVQTDVHDAESVAALVTLLARGHLDDASPRLMAMLRRQRLLIREQDLPRPVLFSAPLEDGLRLVPGRLRGTVRDDATAATLNRRAWLEVGGERPRGLPPLPFAEAVAQERRVLWVQDAATEITAPVHVTGREARCAARLLAGEMAPARLTRRARDTYAAAGLLRREDASRSRIAIYQAAARELRESDNAVLPDLFSPLFIAALRRYVRALNREGLLVRGDVLAPLRNVAHNEAVARYLHHQLVPLVRRVTGEPLKASFCYVAAYLPGARLRRHVDREQCAWNLSVVLDAAPEQERSRAWPIHFEVGGETRTVRLGIGDGILYRGTRPHWRNAQPHGQRTTVCVFHFVSSRFRGRLD